jgi:hypothetical protein
MHQIVRTKLQRNADYHAALAEHYTALQEKAANGTITRPVPTPAPDPNAPVEPVPATTTKRGQAAAAKAPPPLDDLEKLIEMHAGAAEQLRQILADEKPQAITRQMITRPVVRQSGAVRIH